MRKLVLVVLNIYNTVHNYNIKKSGTITGKAAILKPQNETNILVASVDATQKYNYSRILWRHNVFMNLNFASSSTLFYIIIQMKICRCSQIMNELPLNTHSQAIIGSLSFWISTFVCLINMFYFLRFCWWKLYNKCLKAFCDSNAYVI